MKTTYRFMALSLRNMLLLMAPPPSQTDTPEVKLKAGKGMSSGRRSNKVQEMLGGGGTLKTTRTAPLPTLLCLVLDQGMSSSAITHHTTWGMLWGRGTGRHSRHTRP